MRANLEDGPDPYASPAVATRSKAAAMEDASRCSVCGAPLTTGRCLSCEAQLWSRFVHRELVLLMVLIGVTVAAFFGTRALAQGNDALRRRQAATWFDTAQRASAGGNAERAVAGLRRAVSKDPENRRYRLALADALAATGLDEEAKRVLLALREVQPEDPHSNLQLARLEARGPDADATRRYYQSAVAGLWRPEQAEARRDVRTELIKFLLAHDERARALSELLVLAASLPEQANVQTEVARMFLAAGDPRLAQAHFLRALRLKSEYAEALAGAGEAAFQLADYDRALRYLKASARADARVVELREVARLVLDGDPLSPRLGASERRRRLSVAMQRAVQRLDACSDTGSGGANGSLEPLRDEARALQAAVDLPRRRDPRDLVEEGVDLVYRIERALDQHCGIPSSAFDRALVLIGRKHGFEEQ